MSPRTAVVTGATAGIGAAFTRRLAADGYHLVLVSRDAERLTAHAATLSTTAEVLPADLSTEAGRETVATRLADHTRPVELLVNNAGIGLNASLMRSTPASQARLLELNVAAVLRLTHAAVEGMAERGKGSVINVSSVAGFVPMPGYTYAASKAWVTNFSESIGLAARRHGVRVMALCPGYVRTEFHERAGIATAKTPRWLWLEADDVVRSAMQDLDRGRLVSVPDVRYKAAVLALRYLPRWILHRTVGGARRRLTST